MKQIHAKIVYLVNIFYMTSFNILSEANVK